MNAIIPTPEPTERTAPLADRNWSGRHVIIGGGIIGLSIGWQLARRGHAVTIIEKGAVGQGASWVAAGMLAPYAEIGFEEVEFFRMCRESLDLYPRLLEELTADVAGSFEVPMLDSCGTLLVAMTADDEAYLKRFHDFQLRIGLRSTKLSSAEAREQEPLLSPRTKSALFLEADKQINNRTLVLALAQAFTKLGGELLEHTTIDVQNVESTAAAVILAAGAHANAASSDVRESNPIRPVKGQIIMLRSTEHFQLRHMIRSPRGYILHKDDGRVAVGATAEEKGFDTSSTAGAVFDMLRNAYEILPMTYELEITELCAGLRPATRSHLPEIGYSAHGNVYNAIGHYRHGILLAPYTAYHIADLVEKHPHASHVLHKVQPSLHKK